ncbi:MAG: hypothetical protein WAX14_03470 [Rhodococcus sp. (in: high G+C Gram-positive bacteria)]|uniref:hypothetical protein n=1 Tax=Rhodococcus sp. TaxID=1831 RepID=UPI003BB78467
MTDERDALSTTGRRVPTHADALGEFRAAAAEHPDWDIDMDAVLASVRYVRG